MTLRDDYPRLAGMLAAWFPEADLDGHGLPEIVAQYVGTVTPQERAQVASEARALSAVVEFPLTGLRRLANRHFESPETARAFLTELASRLDG